MSQMSELAMSAVDVNYTELPEQPKRSINDVTNEIIFIKQQAQRMLLQSSIEIGRRLLEAKELIGHGGWGDYLKTLEFSPSTAQNLMRISKEYGDEQINIFGTSKTQTFGNLSYSAAVALFAVPEAEREDFVEDNNITEETSIAELKEIIRRHEDEKQQLLQKSEQAEGEKKRLEQEFQKTAKQDEKIKKLEEKNKQLKSQVGKIPEEELKKINDEAYEKAKQQAAEELEAAREKAAQLEEALASAEKQAKAAAQAEIQQAQARAAELEKKLAVLGNTEATKFKIIFEDFQLTYNKLLTCITSMKQGGDAETADKLQAALGNALDKLKERLV